MKKNVKGVSSFPLAANTAVVVVLAPAGGAITHKGNKMLINGVVVDYVSSGSPAKVPQKKAAAFRPAA